MDAGHVHSPLETPTQPVLYFLKNLKLMKVGSTLAFEPHILCVAYAPMLLPSLDIQKQVCSCHFTKPLAGEEYYFCGSDW